MTVHAYIHAGAKLTRARFYLARSTQVASRMYHPPNHHHLFNSIQIQTQGCESGITEATVACGANFARIVASPVERFMRRLTMRLVVGERGQERANESKLTAAAHGHSKQSGERHLLDSQSLLDHSNGDQNKSRTKIIDMIQSSQQVFFRQLTTRVCVCFAMLYGTVICSVFMSLLELFTPLKNHGRRNDGRSGALYRR